MICASLLVQRFTPVPSQIMDGVVIIQGRASSAEFLRYTVEWGQGIDPRTWVRIAESTRAVSGLGALGAWNTMQVPNGVYTLRVILEDSTLGAQPFQIPVTVRNEDQDVPSDFLPVVRINNPAASSRLDQDVVPIVGTVQTSQLLLWTIEVGVGFNPQAWTQIANGTEALSNRPLTVWDTSELENGAYTLRLTARDGLYGEATTRVLVVIDHPD